MRREGLMIRFLLWLLADFVFWIHLQRWAHSEPGGSIMSGRETMWVLRWKRYGFSFIFYILICLVGVGLFLFVWMGLERMQCGCLLFVCFSLFCCWILALGMCLFCHEWNGFWERWHDDSSIMPLILFGCMWKHQKENWVFVVLPNWNQFR